MKTSHHVKSFEEFIAEDLDLIRTVPFDHTDEDELDDTDAPELPEELEEEDDRPVSRFLVDRELEDEDEEGEPS